MDRSRDEDLKRLKRVFDDPNKPKYVRSQAHRSFVNIQRQMRDRVLTGMRNRLVGAIRADDTTETHKIRKQIEEYSYRQGYKV